MGNAPRGELARFVERQQEDQGKLTSPCKSVSLPSIFQPLTAALNPTSHFRKGVLSNNRET